MNPPNTAGKGAAIVTAKQQPEQRQWDFRPFVREDYYGNNARVRALNTLDLLRLGVAFVTLVPLKFACCAATIVAYYLLTRLAVLAGLPDPLYKRVLKLGGNVAGQILLKVLGFWRVRWVYVHPDGSHKSTPPEGQAKPFGGYVSNHCSWIDTIIYGSRIFPSYVAKKDVKDIPLIGYVCKYAMQCLFVAREVKPGKETTAVPGAGPADAVSPAAAARAEARAAQAAAAAAGASAVVAARMRARYAEGDACREMPLLLFPEATTTNNRCLMQFKRGAFVAGVPVQPLLLRYHLGGRVWPTWDTISGVLHIILLFTELSFGATVYVLPVYEPDAEERVDPVRYAAGVRAAMLRQSWGLVDSPATFEDKVAYDDMLLEQELFVQQGQRETSGAAAEEEGAAAGAGPCGAAAGGEGVAAGAERAAAAVGGVRERRKGAAAAGN